MHLLLPTAAAVHYSSLLLILCSAQRELVTEGLWLSETETGGSDSFSKESLLPPQQ